MDSNVSVTRVGKRWKLSAEVTVRENINDVFDFFSDPFNLEQLTPPFLRFTVLGADTEKIQEGTLIRYKLHLHRLPVNWLTRIEEWNPPHKFVDKQLKGPYTVWHHTHDFIAHGDRTIIRDTVLYSVPGGRIVNRLFVENDVLRIFNYRHEMIRQIFDADSA